MTRTWLVAVALAASAAPHLVHACAGCSNPNLPASRASSVAVKAGQLAVTVNVTGTTMNVVHQEDCPEIGPICDQRAEPPQLHDVSFYVGEVRPFLEYGITDVVGVEAQLPVRVTRATALFRRLDGTLFTPDYVNIHHRNETLAGLGDPWLLVRGGWGLGAWRVLAKAGTTLPVGRTETDPFALAAAGLPHQHLQFGTGTFNPVMSVDVARPFGPVLGNAYGQAVLQLYENGQGYRAGNRFMGGLGAALEVGWEFQVGLTADVLNEQPERWGGVIQQEGNIGRTDLLVGGSASRRFGPIYASLNLKVPVWQHFPQHGGHPSQLTYPGVLTLGVQHFFGSGG